MNQDRTDGACGQTPQLAVDERQVVKLDLSHLCPQLAHRPGRQNPPPGESPPCNAPCGIPHLDLTPAGALHSRRFSFLVPLSSNIFAIPDRARSSHTQPTNTTMADRFPSLEDFSAG